MTYYFLDGGGGWRYIIPHIRKGDTIIGSNNSINDFFENFSEANVIRLKTRPSMYDKHGFLRNILSAKKEYKKYFRHIKNDNIVLFGGLTTITFFYYMKKLARHNKIQLAVPNKDFKFFRSKPRFTKYYIPLKIIGYLLGIDAGVTILLGRPMWYLKEKTIKKYDYMIYKQKEPKIRMPDKYKELLKGKKNLVLLNDFSTLCENQTEIFDYINKLFRPEDTILKDHTRNPNLNCNPRFKCFPSYIPSEILINSYDWDNVVSIYITKSLLLDTEKKKISLYNFFKWKFPVSDDWIQKYNDCHVFLPEDEAELKVFLK